MNNNYLSRNDSPSKKNLNSSHNPAHDKKPIKKQKLNDQHKNENRFVYLFSINIIYFQIKLLTFKLFWSSTEIFSIYLFNISTADLENTDIEALVSHFSDSQPHSNQDLDISGVKVYKDCIYIEFRNENTASQAVKFFNNFHFKSTKIQAVALSENEFVAENDASKEDESIFEFEKKQINVDCEIVATSRQLK